MKITARQASDVYYVRWAYEQLLLEQPHLNLDGLWADETRFYVVCPDIEAGVRTLDGKDIETWLRRSTEIGPVPLSVVASPPEAAERLPERTAEEVATLRGAPRTHRDVYHDLLLALPNEFPPFTYRIGPPTIYYRVSRPLEPSENRALVELHNRRARHVPFKIVVDDSAPSPPTDSGSLHALLPAGFPSVAAKVEPAKALVRASRALADRESEVLTKHHEDLAPHLALEVTVDPEVAISPPNEHSSLPGDIDLIPAARLPSALSRATRTLCEEDEDYWMAGREELFTTPKADPAAHLPRAFAAKRSRCLVQASVFPTLNIRAYLPLFRTVVIVAPLASHYEAALASLGVTERELIKLASRRRVGFLFPQPLDRYPPTLLNELSSSAPESVVLSRRLAAATVADSRRRLPLVFPPLGAPDRRRLLQLLSSHYAELFPHGGAVQKELSQMWFHGERSIHRRGAMATHGCGLGPFVAALYEQTRGRELFPELSSAGTAVAWASAIQATVFPVATETYSQQAACEMCASLYSGVRVDRPKIAIEKLDTILSGLLLMENDAPVAQVADAFTENDMDRLHALLQRVTTENVDHDYLRAAISKINDDVEHFGGRSGRFSRLDLVTLITLASSLVEAKAVYLTIGAFILNYVLSKADPSVDFGGRYFDWARGLLTWSSSDAVFVARLRKKLGEGQAR